MSMHKFWIPALAVLSLLPLTARADRFAGLGLGLNFSNFTDTDSTTSGNTEFAATAFADFGLTDTIFLETGLRYTSYGLSGTYEGVSLSESANYLEIPFLLKPTFDAGGFFPYVFAGPVVGFKVSEGATAAENGLSASVSTSIFNTMNVSADLGVGAEVPILPNVRAFGQFDYELGLVNVLKDTSLGGAHTRGAVISVGAMTEF